MVSNHVSEGKASAPSCRGNLEEVTPWSLSWRSWTFMVCSHQLLAKGAQGEVTIQALPDLWAFRQRDASSPGAVLVGGNPDTGHWNESTLRKHRYSTGDSRRSVQSVAVSAHSCVHLRPLYITGQTMNNEKKNYSRYHRKRICFVWCYLILSLRKSGKLFSHVTSRIWIWAKLRVFSLMFSEQKETCLKFNA